MAMRKVKGKKMDEMMDMPSKNGVMYPSVSIPLEALPEAKDWKVGKTYDVRLRIKQTGLHMSKGAHGEMGSAMFDIVGVEPGEEVKGKNGTRYTFEDKDEA